MSNRKFSVEDWNERHFKRVEAFTRRIDLIYHTAIIEASLVTKDIIVDPEKEFTFDDYPKTTERMESLFQKMAMEMIFSIQTGQTEAWDFADQKNDAFVDSFISSYSSRADPPQAPVPPPPKYVARNEEALAAFKARTVDGLGLSDRVWKYTGQFKTELEMAMDVGLGQGKSAAQLSREVRKYLDEPEMLFRRVRNKRGNLALSKAARAYNPGQGVYRSSYKNAMRLTRTEINAAYREADHERFQNLDFVVGFEVRRSNNVFSCDVCEKLKGKYPKTFKFVGWHPQCRCHVISILATRDELRQMNRMILNGEDTTGFRSENEVTDVSDNFKEWVADNKDRLDRAKAKPFFARDNPQFVDGIAPAVKVKPVPEPIPAPTARTIDLGKFFLGDAPTDKEMKAIIMEYSRLYPENFTHGLESVSIMKTKSFLLQCSTMYSTQTKDWIGQTALSISSHGFSLGGGVFSPAEELRGAFAAMKARTAMTFNQEYAVEGLWHEILHAKSKTPPRKLQGLFVERMETLNQFAARHTYDEFLGAFNTKPIHKQAVLDNGYGYKSWVANFRSKLTKLGISEQQALTDLMPALMSDYKTILKVMNDYLKPR